MRYASEIVADGDLSDWPDDVWQHATHYRAFLGERANAADFQAAFAVMWCDSLLYLAARVTDDLHHCVRTDGNIGEGDSVWFSFASRHEPGLWNRWISWGYGLSSVTGTVIAAPTGRFGRVPDGLVYVAQVVKRDDKKGQTIYEAIVKPPFDISHGAVYGFGFTATDNDGFREGSLSTTPSTLTMPGHGGGDAIFVNGEEMPVRVSGRIPGLSGGEPAQVYAFQNDVLKGSTTCSPDGAFDMLLLSGAYDLIAYAGERCSKPIALTVKDKTPQAILNLDEKTGAVRGMVLGADGKTPVPFASIFASVDGHLRARAVTGYDGRFAVTGLEAGTYDLACSVAEGDTMRGVAVARGQAVDVERPFLSALTFDRKPADDELFDVLNEWLAYDRLQTVVDYRRGIDFLSTRSEIDTTRIGVFGGSMGATQVMILAPIEPRIKAVVLRGPGLWADQWNPQPTDQVNFLPRMGERPVLIFNGPYDGPWAVQGTLRILELLPGETKMIWYKTSHTVPPELYLKAMLPWMRENL